MYTFSFLTFSFSIPLQESTPPTLVASCTCAMWTSTTPDELTNVWSTQTELELVVAQGSLQLYLHFLPYHGSTPAATAMHCLSAPLQSFTTGVIRLAAVAALTHCNCPLKAHLLKSSSQVKTWTGTWIWKGGKKDLVFVPFLSNVLLVWTLCVYYTG